MRSRRQYKVTVYKTMPDLFVPTAFTPNGDGHNDIIRPKAIGIKQFGYFRIFNRLGQLVYHTSSIDQGWDGNVSGKPQPAGTYVLWPRQQIIQVNSSAGKEQSFYCVKTIWSRADFPLFSYFTPRSSFHHPFIFLMYSICPVW